MGTTSAVANEFLKLSEDSKLHITNMKLVSMMYIAQGLSLSLLERPLFNDDNIEAWKYGPVIPSIYNEFKHFKSSHITSKSVVTGNNWKSFLEPQLVNIEDKKVVKLTWNLYREVSAEELATSTHRSGTPWSFTYSPYENNIISNDLIKKYYDKFVNNLQSYLKSA
ncbi:MAG TPA: hypothetical protein DDY16_01825 [Tenacibaculum sp.]|nr:hypothetical protein [Tenacibaculum sp.]HBI39674.1 hypothetical protein [Tenacibaculum sp.]